jgi:thiamine-phosphate pyrophosphorylase
MTPAHPALVARPVLCLVTDRSRFPRDPRQDRLLEVIGAALRGGVSLVQVREPDLEAADLCRLVDRCLEAAAPSGAAVVVNDRVDVAVATGAHGVHLRGDSVPTERLRRILPAPLLIGRSVHRIDELEFESRAGVDYLVFGTVFPTRSKAAEHPLAGLDALARAAATSTTPVLAIGGVTLTNVEAVAKAGANGFAAISLFLDADNPEEVARQARASFGRSIAPSD